MPVLYFTIPVFTGRMPFLPPNRQRQSTEKIKALKDHNTGVIVTQVLTTSVPLSTASQVIPG